MGKDDESKRAKLFAKLKKELSPEDFDVGTVCVSACSCVSLKTAMHRVGEPRNMCASVRTYLHT